MLECVLLTLTDFMTLARRKIIKFASAARYTIHQTIGLLNKIEALHISQSGGEFNAPTSLHFR
jgi:hypothetical protein